MDDDADEGWGTLSPMDRARKRYDVEDPAGPAWALHRKHIFILSSAGKPIFSRYGDESKLAPLVGVGDRVQHPGVKVRNLRAVHCPPRYVGYLLPFSLHGLGTQGMGSGSFPLTLPRHEILDGAGRARGRP